MAKVLVNASGANIRPSCASSVNTGRKLRVIINSEKNNGGPTSFEAAITICQRFSSVSPFFSMCLCMFSTITMAASTMAPMAMAIPPNDMMLALMPMRSMTINAIRIPTGSEKIITSEERRWNKNTAHTSATTRNSSISLPNRVSTERSINAERS